MGARASGLGLLLGAVVLACGCGGDGKLAGVDDTGPARGDTAAPPGDTAQGQRPAGLSVRADAKIVGENGGDWAGAGLASGDLDGDGLADVAVGAPRHWEAGGMAYAVFSPVHGRFRLAHADVALTGDSHLCRLGAAIATGDVDGDGYQDLLVGGQGCGLQSEVGHLLRGPLLPSATLDDAITTYTGRTDLLGKAALADVNADGLDDLAIALPSPGEVRVEIHLSPTDPSIHCGNADGVLEGEGLSDYSGWGLATGDVDGDGLQDLLIGAPTADMPGQPSTWNSGRAYVVLGPATGTLSLAAADARLSSGGVGDKVGEGVALGDLDGDGLADLAVSAQDGPTSTSQEGMVYLLTSPVTGDVDLADAPTKLVGETSEDWAGSALAAGDVDGDGRDDLLIGSDPFEPAGPQANAVYLVMTVRAGTVSLGDADVVLRGRIPGDRVGAEVGLGDLDGDGRQDLLIGAPGNHAGAAYVVLASSL